MARTQSTILKAKMRGMELMYKLKNHLVLVLIVRIDSREGSNRELHVDRRKVLFDHGQASLYK
jgi:hypothetical protein